MINCRRSILISCTWVFLLISSLSEASAQNLKDTLIIIASDTLFFSSDSDVVDTIDTAFLHTYLGNKNEFNILLSGHTDSDGPSSYNQKLADRRVQSVKRKILELLPSALFYESIHGENLPIADNTHDSGKAMNRRVDIQIVKKYNLRKIRGQVTGSDSTEIKDGVVYIQHKFFLDSATIKSNGEFEIFSPDSLGARLDFASSSHFIQTTFTTVSPLPDPKLFQIVLPAIEINKKYDVAEMFFVGNQPVLLFTSINALTSLTHTMRRSDICIVVHGHVNAPNQEPKPPGSFEYDLSLNRTLTVRNHLINKGIDSLRIHNLAHSNWDMRFPRATSEEQQQINRRVEIEIKDCNELFEVTQNMVKPRE